MNIRKTIQHTLYFVVLLLGGCASQADYGTTVSVTSYLQTVSGSTPDTLRVSTWGGYYFYTDTLSHRVDSYVQAVQGELSAVSGGGSIVSDGQVQVVAPAQVHFGPLNRPTAVLVLYETTSRLYAWRQVTLEPGLDSLYSRLFFRWRAEDLYKEGGWIVEIKDKNLPPELPEES